MSDYFEIDFLKVGSKKSGDAITIRYNLNGTETIHIVDAGYQDTSDSVINHINKYYDNPSFIDRVILTHPDGDHAGGLCEVLNHFDVGEIWMLRPWEYANDLINNFTRFTSIDNLVKRLKEIYPNIAAIEDIADKKNIPINEPFQGASIGEFTVLSPTKEFYLNKIIESDKTPESASESAFEETVTIADFLKSAAKTAVNIVRAAWGVEVFSDESVSAENEMSIIQYADLCNNKILLTADAGREALKNAIEFAPYVGLALPGINRFQVPHHGSRRNVNTEILDDILGPRLKQQVEKGNEKFSCIISASDKDKDHPRKAVIRALIHRGGKVITTEDSVIRTYANAPKREGWNTATPLDYPYEQEE